MHFTNRQTCTQSVDWRSVVCRTQVHTLTADHRLNSLQTKDLVKKVMLRFDMREVVLKILREWMSELNRYWQKLFVGQPQLHLVCQIHKPTHIGEKPYWCKEWGTEFACSTYLKDFVCRLIQERRYKTAKTMAKDFHGVVLSKLINILTQTLQVQRVEQGFHRNIESYHPCLCFTLHHSLNK